MKYTEKDLIAGNYYRHDFQYKGGPARTIFQYRGSFEKEKIPLVDANNEYSYRISSSFAKIGYLFTDASLEEIDFLYRLMQKSAEANRTPQINETYEIF